MIQISESESQLLSHVPLFVIPWIVHGILHARILQWVASSPGDLPNPGIEPRSPTLQVVFYQLSHEGSSRILEWVAYSFSSRSEIKYDLWSLNQHHNPHYIIFYIQPCTPSPLTIFAVLNNNLMPNLNCFEL